MADILLQEYRNEKSQALSLIKSFWLSHNGIKQSDEAALEDLHHWTQEGHQLYFIVYHQELIGFVHLGSRGAGIDWLEDIFVLPIYQNKGIGTRVIVLVEEIVRTYSESLYIEAAARNEKAIRLYRKLGYECLNTISVRKDFDKCKFDVVRKEVLYNSEFEIRKLKNK
ncbi:GNAT family N-acetyltransferase [Erysipelothrix sp. HDW6A]|uniref:GNAT family N-acetyltransferase n=1 Tax=Erysipelothrix sp. HDW6A TaxID=2714928 RepID=UPI00140A29F3|nr:GNAT family N-acetyltransferase [Erysipelothrix sp. HDW6A]QIK57620.1 GNAT family N-acetyltransferase [Erysipelothrix sp. HDW6A]